MPAEKVIRCSEGHLYTAVWIPFISLRSVRLGWNRRLDHCPVNGKWRMASVVSPDELTESQLAEAREHNSGLR
jgi:hypothetical protein